MIWKGPNDPPLSIYNWPKVSYSTIVMIKQCSTYYFAESFNWYSLDLPKHSCTPESFQSLFIASRSSSENGSVSSIRAITSKIIFASDYKKKNTQYLVITTGLNSIFPQKCWKWSSLWSYTLTLNGETVVILYCQNNLK